MCDTASLAPSVSLSTAVYFDPASNEAMRMTDFDFDEQIFKRELKIEKKAGQDFGISLCRYNGELIITDVLEWSPAWMASLRSGDRLEAVDNMLLRTDVFHRVNMSPGPILNHLRDKQIINLKIADCPLSRYQVLARYTQSTVEHAQAAAKYNFPPNNAGPNSRLSVDEKMFNVREDETIVELNELNMIGLPRSIVLKQLHHMRLTEDVTVCTIPTMLAGELDLARAASGKTPSRLTIGDSRNSSTWKYIFGSESTRVTTIKANPRKVPVTIPVGVQKIKEEGGDLVFRVMSMSEFVRDTILTRRSVSSISS